ncbi:MAG TPA: mannosyltransferase family protein [Thermoanaerobaculaceae bacterium]|nr:mannosyltransferase family protein [Thermoanaerobaculaceae bacterium]
MIPPGREVRLPPTGDLLGPDTGPGVSAEAGGTDASGRWWRRRLYRDVLLVLLLSRVFIFAVAWAGHRLVAPGTYLAASDRSDSFPDLLARFDGVWYLSIVRAGYEDSASKATNIVFFPLYPLLVRTVAATGMDAATAGLVLSNLFLVVGVLLLARLMDLELGVGPARRAAVYLLVFPTSFFFSAVYTESLFLMLTVAAFLAARRGRWWLAGLAGGLAAATRLPGVALVVPLAFEYLQQARFRVRRVHLDGLALAVIPVGLVAFAWYCASSFGDPLAFLHNQMLWRGRPTRAVPGLGLLIGVAKAVLRPDPSIHPFPLSLVYVAAAVLAVGCIVLSFFVLRPAYGIWGLVVLSISTSHGRIDSLPRYVLALLPMFAVLGLVGHRRGAHWVIVSVSVCLLAVFTVMFANGYKMF